MFNSAFIKSLRNLAVFLALYTAAFILFFWTFSYTFPFVIAFIIAFLIQPVTRFFRVRLKMTRNVPALVSSVLVYIVFFVLLTVLFYQIMSEARQLLLNLPNINLDIVMKPIQEFISKLGTYFNQIDPAFIEKNSSQFTNIITSVTGIVAKGLNTFLSIAVLIPVWITVLFIVIFSTYFFSRDMSFIKKNILSVFTEHGREKFSDVWYEGLSMLTKYIKAYTMIYSLTFIETLIGFLIFKVKYAVILSLICAFADILPVLGIGLIYLPLIGIYLITGNYFVAIGLIVLYVIISVVRQIVEPRIVSTTLGIHPIIALAVIFIGLKAYGFLGMIYFMLLVVLYKVLKTAKVF